MTVKIPHFQQRQGLQDKMDLGATQYSPDCLIITRGKNIVAHQGNPAQTRSKKQKKKSKTDK